MSELTTFYGIPREATELGELHLLELRARHARITAKLTKLPDRDSES